MNETTVKASVFKATCLALLDDVERTHRTVIVTKHGRPVAKLVPLDTPTPTMGSVTLLAADDEDYFTTGAPWDVDA
ncbi:type II toxin-antitoxin system Phd/YefM family antitoxin [soil metagenome]